MCNENGNFRPIRRKNKEIDIDAVKKLLISERRGVLALHGDDDYPYAIPINYYYDETDNKIFFHGARVGHKVDSLNRSNKVCFTVFGNESIRNEAWAPYVQSVVVFGHCTIITDESVKIEKLSKLAMKYYPDEATIEEEIAADGKAAQMYVIEIEHLSGKEIQER